jgi:hypothetical protein
LEPEKIEGVYNGKPKHTICAVRNFALSAGNPYTESGIPDSRHAEIDANIYNLGDIIGDTAHLFELSLVENA